MLYTLKRHSNNSQFSRFGEIEMVDNQTEHARLRRIAVFDEAVDQHIRPTPQVVLICGTTSAQSKRNRESRTNWQSPVGATGG
jgi:hypothetical protein